MTSDQLRSNNLYAELVARHDYSTPINQPKGLIPSSKIYLPYPVPS
jgi:hypothetical protein